jgi:hypothetical protein
MEDDFGDPLVDPNAEGLADRFFDRFVFNLHPTSEPFPSLVFGHGIHPQRGVADGFLVATFADEQRNLRWSHPTRPTTSPDTTTPAKPGHEPGPFEFDVRDPMEQWHMRMADNPSGVSFDLTWWARTPAWWGHIAVTNDGVETAAFDHLFQSGRYEGWLQVDGFRSDVWGWWGQRDRSRGVRTMSGGPGLHLWVQAQLPTMSVGFLLVESRDHSRLVLEGAVMHEDEGLDPIVAVRHDLVFDDGLDLRRGVFEVRTERGATYRLDCDASVRGGYLAGGGYGGHHGEILGQSRVEHDRYRLNGSVSPRTLDSPLTDRQTLFTCGSERGSGILEFAHSRSSAYTYVASLGSADR